MHTYKKLSNISLKWNVININLLSSFTLYKHTLHPSFPNKFRQVKIILSLLRNVQISRKFQANAKHYRVTHHAFYIIKLFVTIRTRL